MIDKDLQIKLLTEALARSETALLESSNEITRLLGIIKSITDKYNKLRKILFGRKSEKSNTTNKDKKNQEDPPTDKSETGPNPDDKSGSGSNSDDKSESDPRPKKPRNPKADLFDESHNLNTIKKEEDLPDEEKKCPHDGIPLEKHEIKIITSIEIIPAQINIVETTYLEYKCPQCEYTASAKDFSENYNNKALPTTMAGNSLLTYLIIGKYFLSMPLYRMCHYLEMQGLRISRQTVSRWLILVSVLFSRLCLLLYKEIVKAKYISGDETTVKVNEEKRSRSYAWVLMKHGPRPLVFFQYAKSRSKEVAIKLLAGFTGYFQADAYAGYIEACSGPSIQRMGCMAHFRRKFDEALKINKSTIAKEILAQISLLYAVEAEIKVLSNEERYKLRQERSIPILNKIYELMKNYDGKILPKSLIGQAIQYGLKNWELLIVYTQSGELNIDNNPIENAIRKFATGRKNWLFFDSIKGAVSGMIFYTLIVSAILNNLNPEKYIFYLLTNIQNTKVNDLESLLPSKVDVEMINNMSIPTLIQPLISA
ncbi:MAG: IS66 family transposase [Endomicrobium sp.]|jgi:transposase|nr:IS66 family transposase [Endomicrobium sp.]